MSDTSQDTPAQKPAPRRRKPPVADGQSVPAPSSAPVAPSAPAAKPKAKRRPRPTAALEPAPQPKPRGFVAVMRHACNVLIVAINIVCAAALVVTAFAGNVSPQSAPWTVIAVLAFSFVMPACLLIFIIDLIWWRKTAWIMGAAMIACHAPISDYMPLNLPRWGMSQQQREQSFTLMTYNTAKFNDVPGREVDSSVQLDYILQQRPDVVCVQESNYLAPNPQNHITQQQLDSLHIIYPYVYAQGEDLALFSKFPAEPIDLNFRRMEMGGGNMAAWRLHIHDRVVNIFSVHLQSLKLTDEDKEIYVDMVRGDSISRSELRDMRHEVLPKVYKASVYRTEQIEQLEKYLRKYGGRDAIVCGDFNDGVGCYGIRRLCDDSHMRQAYAEAAFGPDYTFYADYLYFRIDHILYRGDMDPYNIKVRHIKASDHYPVTTTFILN